MNKNKSHTSNLLFAYTKAQRKVRCYQVTYPNYSFLIKK